MSNNEAAHGQLIDEVGQQEGVFNLLLARRAHREQIDDKFSIPNSVSGLGALVVRTALLLRAMGRLQCTRSVKLSGLSIGKLFFA